MIGTAALKKLDSGRCELKALYLLEKYHKKGLGRRLFKLKTPGWNKAEENRSTDMQNFSTIQYILSMRRIIRKNSWMRGLTGI